MIFTTLTPEEFATFASTHPQKSFLQTTEIAAVRKKSGWTPYFFGVKSGADKNAQILAASLIVGKTTFLGHQTFYAPGGPLIDYENRELLEFFTTHLTAELKKSKAMLLHIDPYYELIQRDRDGLIVENGFNHESAAKNLQKLGFRPQKVSAQPKYLFALDLDNRTPDQLLASFKRNTRNHIKKALKSGVVVRELAYDELARFKKITESTSERRHFTDRTLAYYQNMYQLFGDKIKFLLAEAKVDGQLTDLSAAMFLLYGDEIIYLFSGSYKPLMYFNAQYAIQWEIIQYAAAHGFKRYNFYGIQGLPNPKSPDYGVYDFKKGFGGHVIELLGSYILPLSPLYYLHNFLSFFKNLPRSLAKLFRR